MIELLRFVAQVLGTSIAASARPGLTFFVVQLLAATLVRMELATLPSSLAWTVSIPALALGLVLAVLEHQAQHDSAAADLLRHLRITPLLSALGALGTSLLFSSLGLPEEPQASSDLAETSAVVTASQQSTGVKIAVVGAALAANVALTWIRGKVMDALSDLNLAGVWARLETGGVVAALFLMMFLPWIACALLLAFAVVVVLVGKAVQAAQTALDARARVSCAQCDYRVRQEARRCPRCRAEREPAAWLRGTVPMHARFADLRAQLRSWRTTT